MGDYGAVIISGMLKTIGERISYARAQKELTLKQVATACGVTPQAVQAWESGETKGGIKPENLYNAAKVLGVRMEWLAAEKGQMLETESNAEPGPTLKQGIAVPVVGRAKGGSDGYFIEEEYPTGYADEYVTYYTSDPNAYALRIVGTSMAPRYEHGEFVVVEPNAQVQTGNYVSAMTKDGKQMVKKLLQHHGDAVTLGSINPDFPNITLMLDEIEYIRRIGPAVPSYGAFSKA